MKENPLVSIIVSVYNGEKYLRECLDSILSQDYNNIEVIMVDDGSPDNCGSILDEYAQKDKRLAVIHKENSGVCNSRNAGIESSHGDYICIMDQDDIISKDFVSYYLKLIRDNNAEIAFTPTADKFFDKITEDSLNKIENDKAEVISGQQAATDMLYHKIIIAPWNKLVSRDIIFKHNVRFQPQFFNGEGFAYSVECFQQAKRVVRGQRKVYHYRVGDPESGASKFRLHSITSCIEAQKYIRDVLVNKTPEIMKAWAFSNWHSHCDCLNMMVGCGVEKKYPELYRQIKNVCRKQAYRAFSAPISMQQKSRGLLFSISPYWAARIINHFRIRKFEKEDKMKIEESHPSPNRGGGSTNAKISFLL